ncbi:hypothetical protein [Komagataeibacter sp. FXV3]|uniref:hypothetical protein n=1 Tax=Komagataeibacter sp. FXV3 TaxID=2608998 RepID=UPI00187B31A1|nr:hypothetical protein [Komagataeibacter sp. FXV3]MBE7729053.1 hypothetical protein [Komagataeibacter sp. FXV3]
MSEEKNNRKTINVDNRDTNESVYNKIFQLNEENISLKKSISKEKEDRANSELSISSKYEDKIYKLIEQINTLKIENENIIKNNSSEMELLKLNLKNEKEKLFYHLSKKEEALNEKMENFSQQREKYTKEYKENLVKSSSNFVRITVLSLEKEERYYKTRSSNWNILGAFILAFGLILTTIISFWGINSIYLNISWPSLVFYSARGIILLALVGFFTRYTFTNASNHMKEALRISNRIHAIKFGQFYLETYGLSATWPEVKEVFSKWNGEDCTNWDGKIKFEELNNAILTLSSIISKEKEKGLKS